MVERKGFPLRLSPEVYDALQRWAGAELRSLNAQIEFLLRRALVDAGRLPSDQHGPETGARAAEEKRR
jgi:hypothetical protein